MPFILLFWACQLLRFNVIQTFHCSYLFKKTNKYIVFYLFIFPLQDEGHTEWVSCVRFSPNSSNPIIVSCGWDKMVKVCLFFFPWILYLTDLIEIKKEREKSWGSNDLKKFASIIWLPHWEHNHSFKWRFYKRSCDISLFPRCGIWPTASWRPTTSAILATWTQWPSLPMAPCAHLVER